jgi:hypothetical protein
MSCDPSDCLICQLKAGKDTLHNNGEVYDVISTRTWDRVDCTPGREKLAAQMKKHGMEFAAWLKRQSDEHELVICWKKEGELSMIVERPAA